jgi:hypothetical protein
MATPRPLHRLSLHHLEPPTLPPSLPRITEALPTLQSSLLHGLAPQLTRPMLHRLVLWIAHASEPGGGTLCTDRGGNSNKRYYQQHPGVFQLDSLEVDIGAHQCALGTVIYPTSRLILIFAYTVAAFDHHTANAGIKHTGQFNHVSCSCMPQASTL